MVIASGTLTRCLESLEKVERENPATTQALQQVLSLDLVKTSIHLERSMIAKMKLYQ